MATSNQKPVKTVTIDYVDPAPGQSTQLQIINDPGGNVGEVQFKARGGVFGGSNAFVWDNNTGNLGIRGNLRVTGNIYGNLYASSANLKILGGVSGDVLVTDGTGNLVWMNMQDAGGYGNSEVANYLPTFEGELSAGNANLGNAVTAAFFIGDGSLLTNVAVDYGNSNVANYLPTYTGTLHSSNANLGNAVRANYFIGDGSLLTGLPASYANSNVANYLPTYTGNIQAGNILFTNNTVQNTAWTGTVAAANVTGLGNIATINLTGSSSNVLYGNGVFAPAGNGGGTPSQLANGSVTLTLESGGDVLFPSGAKVINGGNNLNLQAGANGTTQIFSADSTSVWTFEDGSVLGVPTDSDIYGYSNVGIKVNNHRWKFENDASLTLPSNGGYTIIQTPGSDDIDMYTGDGNAEVWLQANGNVVINTMGYTNQWRFDNTGNLVLPNGSILGDAYGDGGVSLQAPTGSYAGINSNNQQQWIETDDSNAYIGTAYGTGNEKQWTFGANGGLTLPSDGYITSNTSTSIESSVDGNTSGLYVTGNRAESGDSFLYATNNVYVRADNNGTVKDWVFGADSKLTVPGDILAQENNDLSIQVFNLNDQGGASHTVEIWRNDIGQKTSQFVVGPSNIKLQTDFNGAVTGNRQTWTFDNTGNMILPGNTFSVNYANGTQVSLGGGGVGNLQQVTDQGNTTNAQVSFTNGTDSVGSGSGTIVVNGGIGVSGNVQAAGELHSGGNSVVAGHLFVGPSSDLLGLTNELLVMYQGGEGYVQAAILNSLGNSSADFVAYGAGGTDAGGWADMGFTGNTFNDANYTITGPGDGYIFAHGFDDNLTGGNLIITTGDQGTTKDIIFGTGGFLDTDIFGRISHSNNELELSRTGSILNLSGSGKIVGAGNLYLEPDVNNPGSYLNVFLTTGPDIHIAGNGQNVILGRDEGANVTIGVDGNVSIQANTGTAQTWTFNTDSNLVLPTVYLDSPLTEQTIIRSQRKIIPGDGYSAWIIGADPAIVYTASIPSICSFKVLMTVEHSGLGYEIFEVIASTDQSGNVFYTVSNRVQPPTIAYSTISVDYVSPGQPLAITLTINSGASDAFIRYDATEFGIPND